MTSTLVKLRATTEDRVTVLGRTNQTKSLTNKYDKPNQINQG